MCWIGKIKVHSCTIHLIFLSNALRQIQLGGREHSDKIFYIFSDENRLSEVNIKSGQTFGASKLHCVTTLHATHTGAIAVRQLCNYCIVVVEFLAAQNDPNSANAHRLISYEANCISALVRNKQARRFIYEQASTAKWLDPLPRRTTSLNWPKWRVIVLRFQKWRALE